MPKHSHRTVKDVPRHPVHFHKSGDVVLQAESILFCVHREKLSCYSEVFKDMFSLDRVGETEKSGKMPNIDIQDDPNHVALLLDFMYQYRIDYKNTERCLQLILLAHKYDVPPLVSTCLEHLKKQLPIGSSLKDLKAVDKYRNEPELVILTLCVATLVNVPELLPWAIYQLSTDDRPMGYRSYIQTEDDQSFAKQFSGKIDALHKFLPQLIEEWNSDASDYLSEECTVYWREEGCLRRAPEEDRCDDDGDLLLNDHDQDPVYGAWILLEEDQLIMFCDKCQEQWIRLARRMAVTMAKDLMKFLREL